MSTITEKTWALIPGYTDSKAVLDSLDLTRVTQGVDPFNVTLEEGFARAEVQRTVEQLLASGKKVPDDIAAPIIDARRRDELAVARTQALNYVAQQHGNPSSLVTKGNVTKAFDFLRGELARVLDRAVAIAPALDGATTAAAAIRTAGPANAWQELSNLADQYREIRAVQYDLTRRVVQEETGEVLTRSTFEAVGVFADSLDIHQYWLDLRTLNCVQTEQGRGIEAYSTWMSQQRGSQWGTTGTREYDLVRLATETTPWLPSPADFIAARNAAEAAVQRPLGRFIDRLEEARSNYYAITGATPIGELITHAPIKVSNKSTSSTARTSERFIA